MTRRVRVGDIYGIPIAERQLAAAQVVAQYRGGGFYVAVYDGTFEDADDAKIDALSSFRLTPENVILLGLTLDAKVVSGDWPYLGTAAAPEGLPFPAYRVGLDDDCYVEDHTATRTTECGERGLLLPFRTVVAPAVVEKAVQAKHGLIPWDDYYEPLRVADVSSREAAFFG